jgi:hypothetical protein
MKTRAKKKVAKRPAPKANRVAAPRKKSPSRVLTISPPSRGITVSRGAAAGGVAFGGLGWVAAGAAALYLLLHKDTSATSAPAPLVPAPKPPEPTTVKPQPVEPGTPIPMWSADGKTLNALTGYHRAKTKEVGREMVALAPQYLSKPVGSITYVFADGRDYAVAIEGSHNNHPEIGPTNKGVSLFVKDAPVA